MVLKKIELAEAELEAILFSHPEHLEEGMSSIVHQLATPTGPLDMLTVSEDGSLAVVELKNEIDAGEAPLLQALRYYDWVFENRAWIAHVYKGKGIDPQKEPRLIIVAPDFSENLKRLAKYLSVGVELYRYQGIELSTGEKTIICVESPYDEPPEIPRIASLPQSVERIKDDSSKALYSDCLNQLKQLGFELQPRAKDTISGFYKGKRLLRLYPKQRFFTVRQEGTDGSWTGHVRIQTSENWHILLEEHIKPRMGEMEAS